MTGLQTAQSKKSSWIPWAFVGFFLVVLLANGIMAAFAFGTWTGLSTEGAYEKGLAYNQTLQTRARQAALGWQVAIALEQATDRPRLVAALRTLDDTPLWADSVTARLTRPTHAGHDFEVSLADEGSGRFSSRIDLTLPGLWDVSLTVIKGGKELTSGRRVVWKP